VNQDKLGGVAPRKRMTRRTFLKRAGITGAALVVLSGAAGAAEANSILVSRHREPLPGMPAGARPFRVAQLSDLHRSTKVTEGHIRRAAEQAMREQPDLIVLTGDFITHAPGFVHSCCAALRPLKAPLGVWAILGNHDYHEGKADLVLGGLRSAGIPVLVNRNTRLANGVWLVGLDDGWMGAPDVETAFRGVPEGAAALTLAHNPRQFDALTDRATVVLSGHTHGGQITALGARLQGGRNSNGGYVRGWYRRGKAALYVNRGIGLVGPPIRLFSPPEITVFEFHEPARA
jgi:hypothetical protein